MVAALAEALPVIQRTPEWIEARQQGIGASEAAAALGLSRWESPYSLWARKLGLVPPVESNLAMEIGAITEPLNAARYAERVGVPVQRRNRLMRSKAFPFLLASLDRRRPDGELVELKWTERGDGYGEPGTDQVPDEALCQGIQQMAVTGAPAVHFSVLFGGRRHEIYTVRRDLDAEATVIERLAAFWQHVVDRTEPPLDASDSTLATLRAIYPRDNGEVLEAGAELTEDLLTLRGVKAAAKALEAQEKALRIRIDAAFGAASEVVMPGIGRATYRAPKDSTVVAWQAIAEALDASQELIAEHTTTKPNSRRLDLRWDQEEKDV